MVLKLPAIVNTLFNIYPKCICLLPVGCNFTCLYFAVGCFITYKRDKTKFTIYTL